MADTVKTVTIKINGQDALVDLNEIKRALKETNDQIRDTEKVNLTNFGGKLRELKEQFIAGEIGAKGLAQGVLGVGKAMIVAFITNPIGIAIAAIVAGVALLYNVFKNFEPLVEKIEQAFASLSAIWTVLKDGIIQLVTGNKSLADTFLTLGGNMAEASKQAIILKAAEQDLEDTMKMTELTNAKLEAQMISLIVQSKNRTLSESERSAKFAEIDALESQIFESRKKEAIESSRLKREDILLGKNATDLGIKNMRDLTIAKMYDLVDNGKLNRAKVDAYQEAELKLIQIDKENSAIKDKLQNRIDSNDDAAKAKIEKDIAEAKARAEAAKAQLQKDNQEKFSTAEKELELNKKLSDAERRLMESQSERHQKERIANQEDLDQMIINFETFREEDLKRAALIDKQIAIEHKKHRLFQEMSYSRSVYDITQIAKQYETIQKYDTIETSIQKEKLKREEALEGEIYRNKVKFLQLDDDLAIKKHDQDIKLAKEVYNQSIKVPGLLKDEKIKLQSDLNIKIKQLDIEYYISKKDSDEKLLTLEQDYSDKLKNQKKELATIERNNTITIAKLLKDSAESVIEDSSKTYIERRIMLDSYLVFLGSSYAIMTMSEKELYETTKYYTEKKEKLRKEDNAQKMQQAADLVNKLTDIDKKATETAIGVQQRKRDAGIITELEFDEKVSEIRKNAAKREKAYAVASAIISTAQAIVGMLTVKPVTPLNFALAAAAGVLGAAQIAAILATPIGEDATPNGITPSVSTPSEGTSPNTSFSFSKSATEIDTAPKKTFVLTKDIQSNQQMERAIIANGTV